MYVPYAIRECVRYLEENVGGLGVTLSKEDLQRLEEICPADKVRSCLCMVNVHAAGFIS